MDGLELFGSARQRHKQPVQDAPVVELPKKGRSFLKGFLTNLSNPKAIICFGSVFSLFVGNDVGELEREGLFLLIVGETFAWFTLVAAIFALPWIRDKYQRTAKWVDGVAGVMFAGFGTHLIISR
nr:Partil threonine export protein RhtC [Candidatus Pantoea persica]